MATYIESHGGQREKGDFTSVQLRSTSPAEDMRTILLNRVSWGAVLAGVSMALAIQLILNMLGIGIGVATIDPATGDSPSAAGFSIGAGIWWTISGIIAAYIGGVTAGRMAGEPRKSTAGWHGLIAWAFSTIVIAYILVTGFAAVVSGTVNTVTDAAGAAAQTAPVLEDEITTNDPLGAIQEQIQGLYGGTTTQDPEAQQQMAETADVAADNVSRASLFGAIALLLGALAAWFGGRAGAVDPIVTDRRRDQLTEDLVH